MWTRNRFHNAVIASGLGAGIGTVVGVFEGGLTYLLTRYLVTADQETSAYISLSVLGFCMLSGALYGGVGGYYNPLPNVDIEPLIENAYDDEPALDLVASHHVVAVRPISYAIYSANNELIAKINSEASYPSPLTPDEIENYIKTAEPAAQKLREQECARYNMAIKCCYSQKITLKPITFKSYDCDNRRPSMLFTADADQLIKIIHAHTQQNLRFTFIDGEIFKKGYATDVEQFAQKVRQATKPQLAHALQLFAPPKLDTMVQERIVAQSSRRRRMTV